MMTASLRATATAARLGKELPPELGGAGAHATPGLEDRQDDARELFPAGQKAVDLGVERTALAARDDEPERLHQPADLFDSSVVILTSLVRAAISVRISMPS